MHLDVIIATYNRCELLALTLESLVQARVPSGMTVGVTVVDNNSRDATRQTVESFAPRCPWELRYLLERAAGKSNALNAGIRSVQGQLVGMIDDDEEVEAGWFEEIARAFADPTLDFIGGPYLPRWGAEPPEWLPMRPSAVLGWVDGGPTVRRFGDDYPGTLMGGNAVVKRELLLAVGLYDPTLGPSADNRLLSCEDAEMLRRLLTRGARGEYRPGLAIRHFIPAERMTHAYHRRWFFWNGVSQGISDRSAREPVPYLFGVPRYVVGEALRGAAALALEAIGLGRSRTREQRFDARSAVHRLAGFWYGKHFFRPQDAEARAVGLARAAPASAV
jgi:glycosyltransferase involved in cell wall biosynthesis